jgi:hypothetical protein
VLSRVYNLPLLHRHHRLCDFSLLHQRLVEVRKRILYFRDVRWRQLSLHKLIHVQTGEPGVVQNFLDSFGSQPCSLIFVKQSANQIFCLFSHRDLMSLRVWKVDFALFDEVVHSVLVLVEEGRDAHKHFINQNAQCPPVHRVVMSITDQHLGC